MITSNASFEVFKFPCGEPHVRVKNVWPGALSTVDWQFQSAEELIHILLLSDAIKRAGGVLDQLHIPYIPFGRQDRVAVKGDAFSLSAFAKVINSLEYNWVYTTDPHSDVTPALIDNLVITPQHEVFGPHIERLSNFVLVSPDAGASKKIYKLAAITEPYKVLECTKIRDPKTGAITSTYIPPQDLGGLHCYIVDDICDGGRTFIEIAKILKAMNAGKINLMVTHGFFTQGFKVFDGLIDHIFTREGQVK